MVTSSSSELLVEKKRMRRLVYKFNGLWHRHSVAVPPHQALSHPPDFGTY